MIHTVGPIAQGRVEDVEKEALRSCYRNSLNAATQHAARSVVRTEGRRAEIRIKHKLKGDGTKVAHGLKEGILTDRTNTTQSRDSKLGLKQVELYVCVWSAVVHNQLNLSAHSELLLHSVIKLFITHCTEKQQTAAYSPQQTYSISLRMHIVANTQTGTASSEQIQPDDRQLNKRPLNSTSVMLHRKMSSLNIVWEMNTVSHDQEQTLTALSSSRLSPASPLESTVSDFVNVCLFLFCCNSSRLFSLRVSPCTRSALVSVWPHSPHYLPQLRGGS